jgi:chemotaxis protein MotB
MRNKRKPNADASEGAPAWMNTYGDMVTLMLTFFVLLFSFSTINAKKWEALVQSFSGSTGVVANAGGAAGENVVDMDLPIIEPEQTHTKFDELYATITKHIGENGLETSLEVDKDHHPHAGFGAVRFRKGRHPRRFSQAVDGPCRHHRAV